ncbi:hypothetical protein RJ641_017988, partial [Dillenia turbinata]
YDTCGGVSQVLLRYLIINTLLIFNGWVTGINIAPLEKRLPAKVNYMMKPESHRHNCRDAMPKADIWTDGLICAFEFVQSRVKTPRSKLSTKVQFAPQTNAESQSKAVGLTDATQKSNGVVEFGSHTDIRANHWVPVGWERINELVQMAQTAQMGCDWAVPQFESLNEEDNLTVADLAAPYWEYPAGPIWWCHVAAGHQFIDAWLKNAQ